MGDLQLQVGGTLPRGGNFREYCGAGASAH